MVADVEVVAGAQRVRRRVVCKGAGGPEEMRHEQIDEDRTADAANGRDEWRERLGGRVERTAGQARLGHFLGSDAEEEDHKAIVDQIVDGERVAEEVGTGPQPDGVRPRTENSLVRVGVQISPQQGEHDAELQRHRVRLQPVHHRGDLAVLNLFTRGRRRGDFALQPPTRGRLEHGSRLVLRQQGSPHGMEGCKRVSARGSLQPEMRHAQILVERQV